MLALSLVIQRRLRRVRARRRAVAGIPRRGVSGIGTGFFWPAQSTLLAGLTPPDRRPATFAMQRVMMNLGIGLGALVGGLIATRQPRDVRRALPRSTPPRSSSTRACSPSPCPEPRPAASGTRASGKLRPRGPPRRVHGGRGAQHAVHLRRHARLRAAAGVREERGGRRPRRDRLSLLRQHGGHRPRAAADREASRGAQADADACRARRPVGGVWLPFVVGGSVARARRHSRCSRSRWASSASASASTGPCRRRSSPTSRNRACSGRYMALSALSWQLGFALGPAVGGFAARGHAGRHLDLGGPVCAASRRGARAPPRARARPRTVRTDAARARPACSRCRDRSGRSSRTAGSAPAATMTNMVLAIDDPLSTDAEPAPHPADAAGSGADGRSRTPAPLVHELTASGLTWVNVVAPDVETATRARGALRLASARRRGRRLEAPAAEGRRLRGRGLPLRRPPLPGLRQDDPAAQRRRARRLHRARTTSSRSRTASCCPSRACSPAARRTTQFREQLFAQGSGRLLYEVLDDLFDYCFPILDKIGHKLDSDRGRDVRGARRGGRPRHLERQAGDHLATAR